MNLLLGFCVAVPLYFLGKYLISREQANASFGKFLIFATISLILDISIVVLYSTLCFFFFLIVPIAYFIGLFLGFAFSQITKMAMIFSKISDEKEK